MKSIHPKSIAALQQAAKHHRNNQMIEAVPLYQKALKLDPKNSEALKLYGLLHLQQRNFDAAIELIKKSIRLNPQEISAYVYLGIAQVQIGNHVEAIKNLGFALQKQPLLIDALYNHGFANASLKNFNQALHDFEKILQQDPHHFYALQQKSSTLFELGNIDEAILITDKLIAINPNNEQSYYQRGVFFNAIGKFDAAADAYKKAVAINPNYFEAHFNLGLLSGVRRDTSIALNCFKSCIQIKPQDIDSHFNLSYALSELGDYAEALNSISYLLLLAPNHVAALDQQAKIFRTLNQYANAVKSYERLLAIDPEFSLARCLYTHSLGHICNWKNYFENITEIINGIESVLTESFIFLSLSSSAKNQLACASLYSRHTHPNSNVLPKQTKTYTHEKIIIAYLSADFGDHPITYLLTGLFEQHDRSRFEIIALSLKPEIATQSGQRVKRAFDKFIDVSAMDDLAVANLMRTMEIDIVIDLGGYTQNSRSDILAYRPAPIQINYIGFPGTMGAEFIDYIIADDFIIPKNLQQYYSEKVVYLPECFQANDNQRVIGTPKTRSAYGLPDSGFIFCSFHISYKINPAMFDVWMRILQAVPNSIIWLLAAEDIVENNLRREAEMRGIDASRLYFAPRVAYEDYLARYQVADLFLDTLPFNAGTTASDALWAGLPILTCADEAFASRYAGSLLRAVGLEELITTSLNDYEQLAIKLATTPSLLSEIREKLTRNRTTYPLFNTQRFTRHLEVAYTAMWERYQRGEAPETFEVPALEKDY
jgi:protein O-GlcNAc transferase